MEHRIAPPPPPPGGWPPAGTAARADERARAAGTAAVAAVGLGTVLLAGRAVGLHAPPCPFRALTGVPCPFCGITRLSDSLAHLRIGDALSTSPAGVLLIVGLAVVAIAFVAARARRRPPPGWLGSSRLVPVAIAVVAVHWATSIVFGLPS